MKADYESYTNAEEKAQAPAPLSRKASIFKTDFFAALQEAQAKESSDVHGAVAALNVWIVLVKLGLWAAFWTTFWILIWTVGTGLLLAGPACEFFIRENNATDATYEECTADWNPPLGGTTTTMLKLSLCWIVPWAYGGEL